MRLTKALNIQQPLASQICKGELKILVKPHYFFSDDRIAVYATADNLDVAPETPISVIVGSVRVADCVKVDSDRTLQMIAELTSPEYAEQFPKAMIPFPKPIYKHHYIWVLDEGCLWEEPVDLDPEAKVTTLWTDIDLEDRYKLGEDVFEGLGDDKEEEDKGDDESPLMAVEEFKVDTTAHNI